MMAIGIVLAIAAAVSGQAASTSRRGASYQQAAPATRAATTAISPYPIYIAPVEQRDERTPRQRCWDQESARLAGNLSDLDRRSIDLKCSQR